MPGVAADAAAGRGLSEGAHTSARSHLHHHHPFGRRSDDGRDRAPSPGAGRRPSGQCGLAGLGRRPRLARAGWGHAHAARAGRFGRRQAEAGRREGRDAELEVSVLEESALGFADAERLADPGHLDVLVAHGFEVVVIGRRDRGRRLAVGHHEPGRLGGLRLTARLLATGAAAREHLHGELAHHHPPAPAEAHGPAGLDEPGRPGPRGRGLGEADQVELARRTEPAGARRRNDEVVALPEGQDGRDVAMGDDPGHQGPAFGLPTGASPSGARHSHSMVAGGLLEMS